MSHTYKANVPGLTDLNLVKQAFLSLGWHLQENATTRTWNSNPDRTKVYPLVAINPLNDGYDVGIIQKDGKVELQADLFSPGGIVQQLGKDYGRLTMHYNLAYAKQVAARKGYRIHAVEKDGDLHVEVTQ